MRLMAIIVLGLAALAASASVSRAEDGCGDGWYWDGRACFPIRAEPWHRDEHRDYRDEYRDYGDEYRDRDWHHDHHDYDGYDDHHDYARHPDYDSPHYRRSARYYPPNRHYWHTVNGCPPHYSVQDGLCKPYRGY